MKRVTIKSLIMLMPLIFMISCKPGLKVSSDYNRSVNGTVSQQSTLRTYDYKAGILLIDVIDARTEKLVWEGIGSAEFEDRPKNPDEAISKAVSEILSAFPNVREKK